jgi:restriction system protein
MARRRGFLAEFQHQQRLAQARSNAAARAQAAAQAQVLRARAAAERAAAAHARATEAERKRLAREAQAAYVEVRTAEVAELNEELSSEYAEIDSLLAWTLGVDDWVDLERLKRSVPPLPFPRPDLERPVPRPAPLQVPPPPELQQPAAPKGLFGRKKKAEEALSRAQFEHQQAWAAWAQYRDSIPARQAQADAEHQQQEEQRLGMLQSVRDSYNAQLDEQRREVDDHNSAIDDLISGLAYGSPEAVDEYVSIVLANSVYPDSFMVEHEAHFDAEAAELRVRAIVPAPSELKTIKAYRYVKSTDEIAESQLSKTDANARYAGAVHQVALRSLHEIFEADRRGVIKAISLEVGPTTQDPATGRMTFIPLVAVSSTRDVFVEFDLSGVVPDATLRHLGAAISKAPANLTAVDPSGVRRS